jgi:hypothetical protein
MRISGLYREWAGDKYMEGGDWGLFEDCIIAVTKRK